VSFLNHIVEFVKVVSSGLSGPSSAVHMNVTGSGGFALDETGKVIGVDDSDEGGDGAHEQEAYSALGIIGRPLPAEGDAFLEAIALRTGDGRLPFAFRDLRINRAINPTGAGSTPKPGQLLFAGYGGAFLSHAMTAGNVGSKRGNISTWYVPHDFDGSGVPQKAHAITIDPTPGKSSVSIAHASGLFLALTEDTGSGPGIVASVDGQTFFRMSSGEVTIQAAKIYMKGNCYLGAQAEAGVPLFGGPISPPGPSIFISPV
jgi:hypothetical protein